jgi:simple sugar transport system permease protein
MRTVGANPSFARFAGLGVTKTVVIAQLIGGAIVGLGGSVEILARYDRYLWDAGQSPQYGFDGLVVAVLAHKNPALIPVGAFILAYIRIGADIVTRSTDIPAEFVSIVQGIIILLIAAEMFLSNFKKKLIFKNAKDDLKNEEAQRAAQ